ncbi:MAG TPA: helix-turn-helix domain-containing protein [Candidatus Limnocylindria bacterium]|nr:helix-turn-helix domain-containing protein [Candidatus Limnocylindria bacterium]
MHEINRVLNQLGFSQNETKVYLSALELGVASAQDIAKQAEIKRSTAYFVLGYLVDRGVVGRTLVRGKMRFVAEPPDKLLNMSRDVEARIKKVLPELEAIYNKKETKPKITFFEGKVAVQNVYDDTLREKPAEILEWNTNAYFEYPNADPNYIVKRTALGIRAKRIAGKGSKWDTKHKYLDKKEISETVIVPKEIFWPEIEVDIYNNKVAFMNYAENMSVIIESKAIADAMRQAYALSWEGAKKLSTDRT